LSESPRARLLLVAQCLPYPPHSGVANRTFHVAVELQKTFDVVLVAFSRRRHQGSARERAAAEHALLAHLTKVAPSVPIGGEWHLARRLWDHARSVARGRPYTYYEYGDMRFAATLDRTLRSLVPDLVHMDSLDLFRWADRFGNIPVACTHHSLESDLLRLRAARLGSAPLRTYLKWQAELVERVERQHCGRFALNVMTSQLDADRLERVAGHCRTYVAANGVDTSFFAPADPDRVVPGRVTFLGPLYMFPNHDAVKFFTERVWRAVYNRVPSAEFHVVGRCSAEDRAWLGRQPRTTPHGYVDDVRPYLGASACCVVPIRVGGGTRLKILDAWAMGNAVVSTSIGCEGLEAIDGGNILIRDEPMEFADAVVQVLTDEALRLRLGRNGRRTAEQRYNWAIVGDGLRRAYTALLR
jgi:glycosyltransferase involved in cell wall biosynthesis